MLAFPKYYSVFPRFLPVVGGWALPSLSGLWHGQGEPGMQYTPQKNF